MSKLAKVPGPAAPKTLLCHTAAVALGANIAAFAANAPTFAQAPSGQTPAKGITPDLTSVEFAWLAYRRALVRSAAGAGLAARSVRIPHITSTAIWTAPDG